MRLGISSYTFNWWCGVPGYPPPRDPLTPIRLLDVAAAHDIHVVQIADNLPLDRMNTVDREALGVHARELGITIEAGTRGVLPETLAAHLEICRQLGSPLLRTLLDTGGHRPSEAEAIGALRETAPAFERAGVTLGIENHDRLPAAALRRIVDGVGSPAVGVCLDTANSLGCGEGLATVLDALGEVTVNLHIKDFRVCRLVHGKGFTVTGTPAGRGQVDIPALLGRLRDAGRDVNCILELWSEPEADIEASIEKENVWADESLGYLRPLVR